MNCLSIHLAMSLGMGVGPLISAPFLNDKSGNRGRVVLDGKTIRTFFGPEATATPEFPIATGSSTIHGITTLYPLLGGIAFASALSFLVIGFRDVKSGKSAKLDLKNSGKNLQKQQLQPGLDGRGMAFVLLMCSFFFLYMGMEYGMGMGTFLANFSVDSNLHATKAQGTRFSLGLSRVRSIYLDSSDKNLRLTRVKLESS